MQPTLHSKLPLLAVTLRPGLNLHLPGLAVFTGVFVLIVLGFVLLKGDLRRQLRTALVLWMLSTIAYLITWPSVVSPGLRDWSQLVADVCLSLSAVRVLWVLIVEAAFKGGVAFGVSRIARDITQGALSLIAAIAAARAAGADAQSLATTGGLVTAGLTFSLQQTLSDLVAGLLLQAQAPFQMGDWIAWGQPPQTLGRVAEVNWRATTIVTNDEIEVTVPNSVLARAPIFNYNKPSTLTRCSVRFSVGYDASPGALQELAVSALAGIENMATHVAPRCLLEEFEASGVRYWLTFYIHDTAKRDVVMAEARTRLWYAFRRANIEFVFPRTELALVPNSAESRDAERAQEVDQRFRAIERNALLAPLDDEQTERLAKRSETRMFARGEWLFRKGDTGAEMFILASGQLAVFENERAEIARLSPGEFFGEMALLTGELRSASVRAVTDCTVYAVRKSEFEAVFRENPKLLESVSAIVAERQADNLRRAGKEDSEEARTLRSITILDKMRQFFSL